MNRNWRGKRILISGGSQGLGATIALAAAKQNANLLLVGRDLEKLKVIESEAIAVGAQSVASIAMDAKDALESAILQESIGKDGIHLLVNAVGKSDRGSLESLSNADIVTMFETNVMTTWTMTKACLPSLERCNGSVVNIGSLAGLVATPNLGAYCISKFALTALTRQWRMEFAERNVHFMLVCPGPIAREDSNRRYDQLLQTRGLESDAARKPGGGAKLKLIDPDWLAEQILSQALSRKHEFVVPFKVRILAAMMPIFPKFAESLLAKNLKK